MRSCFFASVFRECDSVVFKRQCTPYLHTLTSAGNSEDTTDPDSSIEWQGRIKEIEKIVQ